MLIEFITQDIIARMMEEDHMSMEDALSQFYTSQTFSKLTDPETGLYLDASPSIYALYRAEQTDGAFLQRHMPLSRQKQGKQEKNRRIVCPAAKKMSKFWKTLSANTMM